MKFFTSEDFRGLHGHDNESMANVANEKLEREGKVVYGRDAGSWFTFRGNEDTHQGLLICVEELPKPECKHELINYVKGSDYYQCGSFCKKRLKPTGWSVADE